MAAIEYLGHEIMAAGLKPTVDKVRALVEATVPKDVFQLRSFLGLVNYYAKFMPNQSSALAPLNQLLQKSRKWSWGKCPIKGISGSERSPHFSDGTNALQS